MSLLSEVKGLLTTVSDVYTGSMPSSPDNAVCLYHSGGYPRDMTGNFVAEPTFQVRVRNTSYATGAALADSIVKLLHGKTTTNIMMIQAQSDVLDLGRDESNRSEFSVNFRCYFKG